MRPEIAARLADIAKGMFAQKTAVTAVTPVTGLSVTAKKAQSYSGYSGYRSKAVERENEVLGPVTGAITDPPEPDNVASALRTGRLPSRPLITSVEGARATVERLLDAMAAENGRRREWWREPVEGRRAGRLAIRNIVTGETTVIYLATKWRSA
ncbi:MAG TPA: hypothetical protein VIF02_11675 [Methylocella sp.]|jgi:hypothetical protein